GEQQLDSWQRRVAPVASDGLSGFGVASQSAQGQKSLVRKGTVEMVKRFAGKVAFVTGAATGIGQATAVRLASEGALVGVNHKPGDDPSETLKRIQDVEGEGFPVAADVSDAGQVVRMVQDVARGGGRLDFVVSNAGINPFMKWDETPIEQFDALTATNYRGTWLVCTEGAKQMVKEGHGGAI